MLLKRKHEPLMFQVHFCLVKDNLEAVIIQGLHPMYTICHGVLDQLHHQPDGNFCCLSNIELGVVHILCHTGWG